MPSTASYFKQRVDAPRSNTSSSSGSSSNTKLGEAIDAVLSCMDYHAHGNSKGIAMRKYLESTAHHHLPGKGAANKGADAQLS